MVPICGETFPIFFTYVYSFLNGLHNNTKMSDYPSKEHAVDVFSKITSALDRSLCDRTASGSSV